MSLNTNTISWNDSRFSTKKVHIPRVKNNFIKRVILVGSYLSCKLKSKIFSSAVKRELIRLNIKTAGEVLKAPRESLKP